MATTRYAALRRYIGHRLKNLLLAPRSGCRISSLRASGFVLIRTIGLPGTIQLAGIINVLIAIAVWQLMKGREPEPSAITQSVAPSTRDSRGWLTLLLTVSLITGASSFIYETGWIRMLSLVLGSSTRAFELMLSAFILGLAFGGLWVRRRACGTRTGRDCTARVSPA